MCQEKKSLSGVCSASSGKARRLYSYLLWCHAQLYNLLPQPAEHWSKSIVKKNPKTVSTISKTERSCRASYAIAKWPLLANTAKQVSFQNGTRPTVIALHSAQHWSTGLFLTYCSMAVQPEPPPLGGVTLYEVYMWVEPGERVYSFHNQVWQFHPFELLSQTPP